MTEKIKLSIEIIKATAYLLAAIYFLWKLVSGYLVSNLTIEPILTRQTKSSNVDYLQIDLKFVKGDRESIVLTRVTITIKEEDELPVDVDLESPYISSQKRMTRLSPGETTQFSHLCTISSNAYCYVEFDIEGYSGFFPRKNGKIRRILESFIIYFTYKS